MLICMIAPLAIMTYDLSADTSRKYPFFAFLSSTMVTVRKSITII
jgi:hypothetical protein